MNYIDLGVLAILGVGFIFGFLGGAKKSIKALIYTAIVIAATFFICQLWTRQIVDFVLSKINMENLASLDDLPTYLANSDDAILRSIGQAFDSHSDETFVLTEFGLTIVRLVLFLAIITVLIVLKLVLSLVLFVLLLPFKLGRKKKKSKHRLLGSIFGVATSCCIALALAIPVSGLHGPAKRVANLEVTNGILGDLAEYLGILDDSVFLGSVGQSATSAFDQLTGIEYGDKTYTLRGELNNILDLYVIIENSGLMDGMDDLESMSAIEMSDLFHKIADIVGALGDQGILKELFPVTIEIACKMNEEVCTNFGIDAIINRLSKEIATEANALHELAYLYVFLSEADAKKGSTPDPDNNNPHAKREAALDFGFGYGMPKELTDAGVSKVIAFLKNEIDGDGEAILPADRNPDNMALNNSVLLEALVPNLLKMVYEEIIANALPNEKVDIDASNVVITDELIGIATFLNQMVAMDELLNAAEDDSGKGGQKDINTSILRPAFKAISEIPESMTRRVIDTIISGMAAYLFAAGNGTFTFDFGISILDNYEELLTMIDLAVKLNNTNKKITDLSTDEIIDLVTDIGSIAIGSPEFSDMMSSMIESVAGDMGVAVPDIDYSQLTQDEFDKSAETLVQLKDMTEQKETRDPNDMVNLAKQISNDAFALNVMVNSQTFIPVTAIERQMIEDQLPAHIGFDLTDPTTDPTGLLRRKYDSVLFIFVHDSSLDPVSPDPDVDPGDPTNPGGGDPSGGDSDD